MLITLLQVILLYILYIFIYMHFIHCTVVMFYISGILAVLLYLLLVFTCDMLRDTSYTHKFFGMFHTNHHRMERASLKCVRNVKVKSSG